jgi:putative spermidine/putrescine transport system substrate-binding protein
MPQSPNQHPCLNSPSPRCSSSSPSRLPLRRRGGSGSSAEQISGLGTSLEDIKQKARDEGQVNLVIWSGYADPSWAKPFTQQTGCKVNTKDGASSDDMIDLLSTGQYDGVSASGNASVRLMSRGDVAPINTDYIPNYADVQAGIRNQSYNSLI